MNQIRSVIIPGTGTRTVAVSTPLNSKRIRKVWADIAFPSEARMDVSATVTLFVDNVEVFSEFPLRWLSSRYYAHLFSKDKRAEENFAQEILLPASGSQITITINSTNPIVLAFEYDDLQPLERPRNRYKVMSFAPAVQLVEYADYNNPAHAHYKNSFLGYSDNVNKHIIGLQYPMKGFFCENKILTLPNPILVKYVDGIRQMHYQLQYRDKYYPAVGLKKTPSDNLMLRVTKTPLVPFNYSREHDLELLTAIFGETSFKIADLSDSSENTGFINTRIATMNAAISPNEALYPFASSKNFSLTLRFPVFVNTNFPGTISGLPYTGYSIDFCFIY